MAIRVALPTLQRSSDSGWTMASCEYGVFKLVVGEGGGGGWKGGMSLGVLWQSPSEHKEYGVQIGMNVCEDVCGKHS